MLPLRELRERTAEYEGTNRHDKPNFFGKRGRFFVARYRNASPSRHRAEYLHPGDCHASRNQLGLFSRTTSARWINLEDRYRRQLEIAILLWRAHKRTRSDPSNNRLSSYFSITLVVVFPAAYAAKVKASPKRRTIFAAPTLRERTTSLLVTSTRMRRHCCKSCVGD